jgi:putative phosphoserine phosphatase/1-acylglycerol-3-phosphate O-acyltransferase
VDTLPDRIDEVRQLYLDTLADWPLDELPRPDLYTRAAARKKTSRRPRKARPKGRP